MKPGEHVIAKPSEVLAYRRKGLELRDSVLVLDTKTLRVSCLLRSPVYKTVVETVRLYATGALNIDASRVYTDWQEADRPASWKSSGHSFSTSPKIAAPPGNGIRCHALGRWPPNLLICFGAVAALDAQSGYTKKWTYPKRIDAGGDGLCGWERLCSDI